MPDVLAMLLSAKPASRRCTSLSQNQDASSNSTCTNFPFFELRSRAFGSIMHEILHFWSTLWAIIFLSISVRYNGNGCMHEIIGMFRLQHVISLELHVATLCQRIGYVPLSNGLRTSDLGSSEGH